MPLGRGAGRDGPGLYGVARGLVWAVSGRGRCWVAAFWVSGVLELAIFFITISHTGCLNPAFSELLHEHASPPVTSGKLGSHTDQHGPGVSSASPVLAALPVPVRSFDGLFVRDVVATRILIWVGGCKQRGMRLGLSQSLVAKRVGISGRRRRGSDIGRSGEHRTIYVPKAGACTLGTLASRWWKGVFFASFLCRRRTKK